MKKLAGVVAVLAVLLVVGINVPDGLEKTLIGLVTAIFALLPYLTGLQIRGHVFAPSTVADIKIDKFNDGYEAGTVAAKGQ